MSLAVISTHPIQYHAPVYRALQKDYHVPVSVIYGSDFSLKGYRDLGFGVEFAWDTDLLSGYTSLFLSSVANGGPQDPGHLPVRGLKNGLRLASPKAVLILGYTTRFYQYGYIAALSEGRPLLFRGEVTDHALMRGPLKRLVRDFSLRLFYQRFSALLYIGKYAKEHYRRLGVQDDRLFFSPYCVDSRPFRTEELDRREIRVRARSVLGLDHSRYVALFSGKLIPKKSPDLLLDAFRSMPVNERQQWGIIFLGDGEMHNSLERQARGLPEMTIQFVGFRNQSQLSDYFHAADLLVLPSHQGETWGLVVNEALHHGLPCVVSSSVGCAPDLIEPGLTGEIFETGSVPGLRSALERATVLVDREETRDACRERVSHYTVQKAAEGIAEAYFAVGCTL